MTAYNFMLFRYKCWFMHFTLLSCALNIYYPILILSIIVDYYVLLSHTAFNIRWSTLCWCAIKKLLTHSRNSWHTWLGRCSLSGNILSFSDDVPIKCSSLQHWVNTHNNTIYNLFTIWWWNSRQLSLQAETKCEDESSATYLQPMQRFKLFLDTLL